MLAFALVLLVWLGSVAVGGLAWVLAVEWQHPDTGLSPIRVGALLGVASFLVGVSVASLVMVAGS